MPRPRSQRRSQRRSRLESLERRLALDSTVVFSEIMYHPADGESLEWIELHNQMAVNVDISGWRLDDAIEYTFPEGTVIAGGDYLVVAADVDALAAQAGLRDLLGPYQGRLNNGGERIELRSHTNRLMNEVAYDDEGDWPLLADGSGASLAKARPQSASDDPRNWRASEQVGGTPGHANFPVAGSVQQTRIVPMDSTWRYEQSGTDLGVAWRTSEFDDASWEQGPALLYVERSALPGPKNTSLTLGQNTYYFRQQFDFSGDTESAKLQLNHIIDDGAVFYLNGQEVARFNMPNGLVRHTSPAENTVTNGRIVSILLPDANLLRQGKNTLAVEVHQAKTHGGDVVMGLELALLREITDNGAAGSVVFSEIPSSSTDGFWMELHNTADSDVNLEGWEIVGEHPTHTAALSELIVPAGGFAVIDQTQLDWVPDNGERVFLYGPGRRYAADAFVAGPTLRARSAELDFRWQMPNAATPGALNTFAFQEDVVINEIMYHARPTYATAPRVETVRQMDFNQPWRYDQSDTDQGTAWREPTFDDSAWPVGRGLFHQVRGTLPGPKSTELTLGPTTFYFRTTFEVSDPEALNLTLEHVIDDGAVFYLNGHEIERFNMPSGTINHATLASRTVRNGSVEGGFTLPKNRLVVGENVLAVEIHQQSTSSPDVAFGVQLNRETFVIPGTAFEESDEEWIELYNRGDHPVNLSRWTLADGVEFEFPQGTVLLPGQYAVIAKDVAQLSAKYPDIQIIGQFNGTLSNSGERIQLNDNQGNVADEVHYYSNGRWSSSADGNGSSLELQDPRADNATAEAWAASDESGRSQWQHVSYRGIAEPIPHDPPINFHEFVMGLLAAGEVLIDNLSVTDPNGKELIQNGSFDSDRVGREPASWRIQGTHEDSQVIVDPDDPSNQVLQLVAEARMNYLSNHAETTLADRARVVNGVEYLISYDAKWITGSPQLHTELYYEDAARTTILQQPSISGTPGKVNSTAVENLGPTYESLSHWPVVPTASESVTIRVTPSDPDGVQEMTLYYSVNGGSFRQLSMTVSENGSFSADIPAQSNGRTVQFYVSGVDSLGATTLFPAAGRDSRALYKVDSRFVKDPLRHDFQIIMTPRDANALHVNTNLLDNDRVGSTVIYNGSEVFYNTGTRLRGSMFSRNNQSGTGYNVKFNADQLFRGVHESIGFDQGGEREILSKFMAVQTGSLGGTYDDIFQLETPTGSGGGPTLVYLARHQDIFLDEQFEDGASGTLFKMEGIRVMTNTVDGQPESRKIYQPIGWVPSFDIQDLGDDPEKYRWPFLINNNRKRDDYSRLIDMAKAFSARTSRLQDEAMAVLDVENVTHTFALMSLLGIGDTYSQGNPHNLNIYVRPTDQKILMFPWDWDFTFSQPTNAPLHGGKNIGRVLNQPHFAHFLLGQLEHMIQTRFNREYMTPWTAHFGQMLGENLNQYLTNIRTRGRFVEGQLPAHVPFEITSTSQRDTSVLLRGNGWVNVKNLRLAPDAEPIDVEWTSATTWAATLPLAPGRNAFSLMAYDFGGERIDTVEFSVTSEVTRPLHKFLRISEINYHPAPPTGAELAAGITDEKSFEFMELVNASRGELAQTLELGGVSLADGIEFTFPAGTQLAAGERIVVVSDRTAFRQRYDDGPRVAGEFELQLSNQGERVSLKDDLGLTIVSVAYQDSGLWPPLADGLGASLELLDAATDPELSGKHYQWRASVEFGGSPGREGLEPNGIVISEVRATRGDAIELFNSGSAEVDLSGWYLSDDARELDTFRIPNGTTLDAGEYIVFDDRQLSFGLSSSGDDVWLVRATPKGPQFIDEVHFDATSDGQSLGLTEHSNGRFTALTRNGLGCGNGQPFVADTRIQLIQYLPGEPAAEALVMDPTLTRDELEYVSIHGAVDEGWRLVGGIEFEFSGPANVAWVVSFDPTNAAKVAAFGAHYGWGEELPVTLVGPFQGSLSDTGEQILLQRLAGQDAWETVDEVIYDDQGDWPAARAGDPIWRKASTLFGNDGANWVHLSEFSQDAIVDGDYNGNGIVDATDVDLLIDAVNRGSHNAAYVRTGTMPQPTFDDVVFFVEEFFGTGYGDNNLDGKIDEADVHEPGPTCDGWRGGDFNGDNWVDDLDLALARRDQVRYDFFFLVTLAANFGKSNQSPSDGDLDGDGHVGFSDFLILSANFGKL